MKKTNIIQLEMMKQSYIKKLAKIESEINKLKGVNTNEQVTRISSPVS
jgi:hypothetical protein